MGTPARPATERTWATQALPPASQASQASPPCPRGRRGCGRAPRAATKVAEPPPLISAAQADPAWTECFLESRSQAGRAQSIEVWVFRTESSVGFEKLLKHRHFNHEVGDELSCRSRHPDAELECLECTRVVFGGVYGSIGVVVPVFPLEAKALGCLSRSRLVEADFSDDDNYDGNPTREVALCNSHRGQFDAVNLAP